MFDGKKILVAVCGGIAAYKTCELVRELQRKNAIVRTILTPDATRFISPLTFEALTGAPVSVDLFQTAQVNIEHIDLAHWPDLILVAPATANSIAKFATGFADNLVTATILATRKPIILAPAMNTGMWENNVTKQNIQALKKIDFNVVSPEFGAMASRGEGEGVGRLAEIPRIVAHAFRQMVEPKPLKNVKITITAGRTEEDIDPVRFLTNRSTGKMGYALAEMAIAMGADVTLISGPTEIAKPYDVKIINVRSAREMFEAAKAHYPEGGGFIAAAAVADFRPKVFSDHKIKKDQSGFEIKFEENPDILLELGKNKNAKFHIGFALETRQELEHATKKLKKKNLDFIVVNNPMIAGAGFAVDTNQATILASNGEKMSLPMQTKLEMAREILQFAVNYL